MDKQIPCDQAVTQPAAAVAGQVADEADGILRNETITQNAVWQDDDKFLLASFYPAATPKFNSTSTATATTTAPASIEYKAIHRKVKMWWLSFRASALRICIFTLIVDEFEVRGFRVRAIELAH